MTYINTASGSDGQVVSATCNGSDFATGGCVQTGPGAAVSVSEPISNGSPSANGSTPNGWLGAQVSFSQDSPFRVWVVCVGITNT